MSYSRLIIKDRADIAWPLDNISESSSVSNAINFFSNQPSLYAASINAAGTNILSIPIVFGGGTALAMKSSSVAGLSIPLIGRFSELYTYKEYALEFWIRSDKMPSSEMALAKKRNFSNMGLFLKENYIIYRYGNSASYLEVAYGLAETHEPTHIVMNYSPSGIELIINGVSKSTKNILGDFLPVDANHSVNDYMDFYGSENYNVIIDCPALYPFCLGENIARVHYVYGLGKNVSENIFFANGGDYYNFSTTATRKSDYEYWDFPGEWRLTEYNNLGHDIDGITSFQQVEPSLISLDGKLNTANNNISFTSSVGTTIGSYIELSNLNSVFDNVNDLIFVKFETGGQLPADQDYQTLMVYGQEPLTEIITMTLNNYSSSYYLVVNNKIDNASTSFFIQNITSSPSIYVGMQYLDGFGKYYFAQSGSAVRTSSVTFLTSSALVSDSLSLYMPPSNSNFIRIGSRGDYNNTFDINNLFNTKQFTGKFIKFMIARDNISTSTFNNLDSYEESPYSFSYLSSQSRFKIYSYGEVNFTMHGPRMAEVNESGSFVLSANRIEFGYPDVYSGSQVKFYATLFDYTSSVAVYPKTQLNKINHLEWLNLRDLSSKYLDFTIEVRADDVNFYPPYIKYFKGEFYPNTGSYVDILDDGGDRIRINTSASGHIFLPEFDETPTVFVHDTSGVKVFRNTVDVEFNPPTSIINLESFPLLRVRLDARYPQGFNVPDPNDSVYYTWTDLSSNSITASSSSQSFMPEYRIQSLNMLPNNIANGSESGSVVSNFNNGASVQSSTDYEIYGNRSIAIVPNRTSASSYMQFHQTNLLNYIFPGETYTAIGTVSLPKPFTTGSVSANPATIQAWIRNGGNYTASISASPSSNAAGSYSLSVTFSVPSAATEAFLRFYNGSSASQDVVYWDNLALYSGSTISGSPITSWFYPYERFDDRPVFKFNGASAFLISSITVNQPMTVYMVARGFGDDNTFIGHSASAPAIYSSAGFYRMSAGNIVTGASINNNFNIIVGVFNGSTSSLFVNDNVVSGNAGTGSYSSGIRYGYRLTPSSTHEYLKGDIASILVYNQAHTKNTIDTVKLYLKDQFNIL